MLSNLSKYAIIVAFLSACFIHSSCTKSEISPANQELAFIKYYGHVKENEGKGLVQTSDLGYILIGSSNSYTTEDESDIFVVKTDSLGNEQWSMSYRKPSESVQSGAQTSYNRYDEDGIAIFEQTDGTYLLVGTRTTVNYPFEQAPTGTELETKTVIYSIDGVTGAVLAEHVVRENSGFDEEATAAVIDTAMSRIVITGMTTRLRANKPNGTSIYDTKDIFIIALDKTTFAETWSDFIMRGLEGEDASRSIHVLANEYLLTGTVQRLDANGNLYSSLLTVNLLKATGTPTNVRYWGNPNDEGNDFEGGYSAYDPNRQTITVVGSAKNVSGVTNGSIVLFQVNESLNATGSFSEDPSTFMTYKPTENLPGAILGQISAGGAVNKFTANHIAINPDDNDYGFIISSTYDIVTSESNVAILKIKEDYTMDTGWPYFFGYHDPTSTTATADAAGAVIPVVKTVTGTTSTEITGYAFTGTFNLGTNNMIGLVKVKPAGTLN